MAKGILQYVMLLMTIIFAEELNAQTDTIEVLRNKLTNNVDTTQVSLLSDIGDQYTSVGKYDSALYYFFKSLNKAEKITEKKYSMRILSLIADLYLLQKKTEPALMFATKALKLAEEEKDPIKIYKIQSQIGLIYFNEGKYDQSLEYALKNLAIMPRVTEKEIIVDAYMRMADVYKGLSKYDSAIRYENKAIEVAKTMDNKAALAMCINNLGTIHQVNRNQEEALKNFLLAFSMIDTMQISFGKVLLLMNISGEYSNIGNLDKSLEYAKKAMGESKVSNDKEWQKETIMQIATIYANKKQYKEAYEYFIEYDHLKDSLNTSESQNKLFELQSRYENDQKEKQIELLKKTAKLNTTLKNVFIAGSVLLIIIVILIARQYRIKKKSELSINKKNIELSETLNDLRSTQAQLIQSEKMASLGELTAGIAHEIQNPLNFVNNFSDVNKELLLEMNSEIGKGNYDEVRTLAKDIADNEEKINHHGKRADAIVKGMLQHSRSNIGVKEPTDINTLADEYLRLSYHGLRAKDKSFNAKFETDFDNSIGKVNIIPQDIGRVILNLINNAFYAVNEKQNLNGFEPKVIISTSKHNSKVEIKVADNGNGIPKKVLDKIFQPFFTTKPTGQGTGLGLSLSYDIVKAHGGEIKVNTKENEGTEFTIVLPG